MRSGAQSIARQLSIAASISSSIVASGMPVFENSGRSLSAMLSIVRLHAFAAGRGRNELLDATGSGGRGGGAAGLLVLQHAVRSTSSARTPRRSEEHTSELQSQSNLVCRLLLEK